MPANRASRAKNNTAPVAPQATGQETTTLSIDAPDMLRDKGAGASLALQSYGANPLLLELPDNMAEADFLATGVNIGRAFEFASWRLGDWANYGLKQYGYKDYSRLAGVTGLGEDYLRTCSSVAARVPATFRAMFSLEKAKLALARKGTGETVDKCLMRLKDKTTTQLREMGKSGNPGGGSKDPFADMSAEEFYNMCGKLSKAAAKLPQEKWPLLATKELTEGDSAHFIEALLSELKALLAAIAATSNKPA